MQAMKGLSMKKRYIIPILLVLFIGAMAFYYSAEMPVVEDPSLLEFWSVTAYLDGEEIDLTDEVDMEALATLLGNYTCKVATVSSNAYTTDSVQYECNGSYDGESFHLLLGKLNVVYGDSLSGRHTIVNEENLLQEVDALFAPYIKS